MTFESPDVQAAVSSAPDMVSCCADVFVNELGNRIVMSLEASSCEVTIRASGPSSTLDHTWTHMEAERLRDLLVQLLGPGSSTTSSTTPSATSPAAESSPPD